MACPPQVRGEAGRAAESAGVKVRFVAVPLLVIAALTASLHDWERRVYTTYWDALGQVYTACAGVTGEGVDEWCSWLERGRG